MTTTELIQALSGLLTPVIAVIVAFIAYQQYVTSREKLRLDLFDKRLRIYTAARDFLKEVFGAGQVNQRQIAQFALDTCEAGFLFPNDNIDQVLVEMQKKARDLILALEKVERANSADLEVAAAKDEILGIRQWFSDQSPRMVRLFTPYLRFKK